jgi:regulation of enolase protein 1 (concanavalin A-like superfamily)
MIPLTTRHRALPLYVLSLVFSFFSSLGIAHAQLSPTDTEEFISWVVMMDGANWSTTGNPPFPMNYDQQQVTVIGDICNYPGIECANANTIISTFEFAGSETIQIVGEFAPFCDFSVFETLQFLTLSRFNDLVGPLPNVECLSSLVSLSVSNNNLSGSVLDKGIPSLLELGFLDLSNNAFEGNVPNIQNDGGLTTRLFNNQFDFVPESWTVFKRDIAFNPFSVLPSTCDGERVANNCQPRTLPRIFQSGNTLISKSDNFPLQWKNISTNTTYPNATGPFTIPCHGTYTVIPDAPNIVGSGETGTSNFNSLTITGVADTLTIDLVDNQVALSDGQNLNIQDLVGGTVLGTLTWGTSPGSFPNAASTPVNINENTTLYVRDETAAGCVSTAQIDIRLATQGPAVYVDDSATGANNGTSWADAYTSLQDALSFKSLSGSGAEIWVAAGTYYPDEGSGYTDGDRMAAFQLRNNLTIYGGFAGDEPADFDVDERDIDGNPTILSGDIDKDGLLDSENSLHVVFNNENGLDATAVLDGFTISGGLANGERLPHERGGGVLNKGVAPTIRNCTFTGNEARHNGGGMFNYEAAPTVVNCLFFENTANLGGAVYNYFYSAPVYTNCTFTNNTGLINGAGLYNNFYANTVVNNSIFWGNTGIQVFNNASTLSINNAIIEGGCPAGYDCTNVSDQDPQFLDAAADNFQLSLTSPAIGAGNGTVNNAAIDLAGNPRTSGGVIDLGALQNQRAAYVNDDATGSNDGSSWANAFNHLQDALAYAASEPLITQIWIAEGTYTPDQGVGFTAGDRNASFSMQNDLAIYGGFPNTGNPNLTDRDWAANVTILSGDIGMPGVETDNSRRIIYNNGLNNTAVLDGLTVSDAYNEISVNGQDGAGMFNTAASPIIQNCIFRNNDIVEFSGAAVYNQNASPEFINCLFLENSSGDFGGALFTLGGAVRLSNCTFVANSSFSGSAIGGFFSNTNHTLNNCIFWGNLNSSPIFNGQGASTTITYSVVEGGYPGTGNLSSDPLFVDATNGDFRLQACSPAIDAGISTGAPAIDLDGNPRPINSGFDMGAYEFQSTPTPVIAQCQPRTVDLDTDGNGSLLVTDLDDGSTGCGPLNFDVNSETVLSFSCADVGTVPVQLTVTDDRGQTASCMADIMIEDNVQPTALCRNVTVQLDGAGNASITAADIDGGSNDACGIANLSAAPNTFNCSNVGANTSTLTVVDVNGNNSTCTATVTVVDNNVPTAVCADPTVNLTSDGITTVDASFFDGGSLAVCPDGPVPGGGLGFSASMTEFDCDDVGETYTVTLTVTSKSNGLSDQCTSTVSVADPNSFCCAPPMAACEDITVQLDANGSASITPASIGSASTAECGLASESLDKMGFDCADVGGNTVTYTITDVNGDTDNCTANVTVEDNLPPSAVCLSTTVELQPDGMYDLQQSDVYDSINSADNCSIATFNFSATTFDCEDEGQAFPITVTVTDPSGNTDNCTANVTVDQGDALPAEWAANDIGDPGNGSDYAYDPCAGNNPNRGDFTIRTGGYNLIPQNSDNLAFATVPLCGNGGIQARIESVSGGYAGLMIRESSTPGAKMVAVYSNLTNLLRREIRTVTNGTRSSSTLFASFPKWLRLVRQGDYIRAFYRNTNGGNWTLFHQAYVPMGNCVEMGLAVFTTDPNGDASAVFGRVNYQSQGGQNLSAPNGIFWEAETPEVFKASVLPNPVRNHFTLQFSKPLPAEGQATLLNEFGQGLSQQPLRAGERELGWDAGALPAGLYFLEVATEDGYREVLKVVRQ